MKSIFLPIAFILIGVISMTNGQIKMAIREVFSSYVNKENLKFSSYNQRNLTFKIFENNLAFINHINSQNLTYTAGLNPFTHLVGF